MKKRELLELVEALRDRVTALEVLVNRLEPNIFVPSCWPVDLPPQPPGVTTTTHRPSDAWTWTRTAGT